MIDKVGAGLVLLDPYVTLADAVDGENRLVRRRCGRR